ncbi:hypothetical protein R1flu_028250 [Riccia fluitans]|uniref:Uncharacterized protein n=1 Tax=Riccia fluitans TaxID=41844 RepID=A0ABD1XL62_9MARC
MRPELHRPRRRFHFKDISDDICFQKLFKSRSNALVSTRYRRAFEAIFSSETVGIWSDKVQRKLKVLIREKKSKMTRVTLVMFVAVAAVAFFAPPIAARSHHIRLFPRAAKDDVLCVGSVVELLQLHEGRQFKAYDHKGGFRAVGAGYNLDYKTDKRRSELQEIGLDYDRVYNGEMKLDDLQISELLVRDAKRALRRAGKNLESLNELCCALQAVFADIQHTVGSTDNFPRDDLDQVIQKTSSQDFKSAADELERTKWCSDRVHKNRCEDNLELFDRGCPASGGREGCF